MFPAKRKTTSEPDSKEDESQGDNAVPINLAVNEQALEGNQVSTITPLTSDDGGERGQRAVTYHFDESRDTAVEQTKVEGEESLILPLLIFSIHSSTIWKPRPILQVQAFVTSRCPWSAPIANELSMRSHRPTLTCRQEKIGRIGRIWRSGMLKIRVFYRKELLKVVRFAESV